MDKMLKTLQVGTLSRVTNLCGLQNFPISTVVFAVQRPDRKILEIRQLAGAWYICGGLQCRGETMDQALWRVAGDEIGLTREDVRSVKLSHVQDVFNSGGENEEGTLPAYHSVWHFYVLQVDGDFEPLLDGAVFDFRWTGLGEFNTWPVSFALAQAIINKLL